MLVITVSREVGYFWFMELIILFLIITILLV
jgi:hypothetical protein